MAKSCIKKLTFHSNIFNLILTSRGCISEIDSAAAQIQRKCGEGYTVEVGYSNWSSDGGSVRYVAFVGTATQEARIDEAENKTLERAIGGGS